MEITSLSRVGATPAGHALFRDLSWSLLAGERVGLVGPNAAGKSTLLKIVAGEIPPDEGEVTRRRGLTVGYLPQQVTLDAGSTVLDCAAAPSEPLARIEAELSRIESQLADPAVYGDERRLSRALERQEAALVRREELGGSHWPGRARSWLIRFGFGESDFGRRCGALSGGEKRLVALAALAMASPDLLLLDEPDNHLDLAARERIEEFIAEYPGAVVVVSHDRYLLDATVGRIAELDEGRLTLYPGSYSDYASQRELDRLRQQREYAAQRKEIQRIEASIERFERWASMVVDERHIKQARSRRRALQRMEERGEIVEKIREARRMDLALPGGRGSRKAVELRSVSMGFGAERVFVDVDLLVRHGERVGLVGPNGCGKSVLLKLVGGSLTPLAGEVRIGPSARLGYYAQEHETLSPWRDRTPLAFVRDAAPMAEGAAVSLLMKFLFRYDQVRQPIADLSGGERSRLQLARLVLERPNLLLLDEPTNHLDIPSAEVLESALEDFEGALLVVSHDRYFLDRVVDRVVELEGGSAVSFPGGYTDYRRARSADTAVPLSSPAEPS